MNHKKGKSDQIVFELKPEGEKMIREKVSQSLDEIKFEKSKLVASCYQKIRVCELYLRRLLIGGIYNVYSDLSSEVTVSEKEIESGIKREWRGGTKRKEGRTEESKKWRGGAGMCLQ